MILWLAVLMIFTALLLLPLRAGGQTLAEAAEAVDECVVKAELKQLVGPVAEVVGLEKSFVEKTLAGGGTKVSDLVFIKALADKGKQAPALVRENNPKRDWPEALKKAGIGTDEMLQKLDDAYADLALKMMDLPGKRKALKPTAKR
jgi:hypothetical protein